MVLLQRDAEDRIQGVIHCLLVDATGALQPKGSYVFVDQLELNPGISGRRMISYFIRQIAQLYPWTKFAYWERRDKLKARPRTYTRGQLLRGGRHHAVV